MEINAQCPLRVSMLDHVDVQISYSKLLPACHYQALKHHILLDLHQKAFKRVEESFMVE